jgi:uncharacterized protein YndB with AHSA1/START domain
MDNAVIDQQITIAAPPEVVFAYFIDPDKLVRWLGSKAELEAKPGGNFWVDMNGRDVVSGSYVEVTPPTRVVFTWGWELGGAPVAPGSSTVEVTLTPEGDGTLVRLVHRDLPDPTVPSHDEGWTYKLGRLAILAAGGDPGPDQWM